MGCANCPKNSINQGLVIISEPSFSDDSDGLKVYSMDKTKVSTLNKNGENKDQMCSISSKNSFKQGQNTISNIFPSTSMLKEINLARTEPLKYIEKIESLKKSIVTKNNHTFLKINNLNNININLDKGIESFNNCISFLRKLAQQKKLAPLIMREELKIPFPINSPEICINKDYIKNILMFKTEENKNKFKVIDFHYDLSFSNVELSTILQIIDDTNSNYQRRKNIFNPKAKYIGISEGTVWKDMHCYYLLFAE